MLASTLFRRIAPSAILLRRYSAPQPQTDLTNEQLYLTLYSISSNKRDELDYDPRMLVHSGNVEGRVSIPKRVSQLVDTATSRISRGAIDPNLCGKILRLLLTICSKKLPEELDFSPYIRDDLDYDYKTWLRFARTLPYCALKHLPEGELERMTGVLAEKLDDSQEIAKLSDGEAVMLLGAVNSLVDYRPFRKLLPVVEGHFMRKEELVSAYIMHIMQILLRRNEFSKRFSDYIVKIFLKEMDRHPAKQVGGVLAHMFCRYNDNNSFSELLLREPHRGVFLEAVTRNSGRMQIKGPNIYNMLAYFLHSGIGNHKFYSQLLKDTVNLPYDHFNDLHVNVVEHIALLGLKNDEIYVAYSGLFERKFVSYIDQELDILPVEKDSETLVRECRKLSRRAKTLRLDNTTKAAINRLAGEDPKTAAQHEKEIGYTLTEYQANIIEKSVTLLWSYIAFTWTNTGFPLSPIKVGMIRTFTTRINKLFARLQPNHKLVKLGVMEKLCQINMFFEAHLKNLGLHLDLGPTYREQEETYIHYRRLRDYLVRRQQRFEGPGVFNGFYAAGRDRQSGKLIILNQGRSYYFEDTQKYNSVVELRRHLLETCKQSYVEVNHLDLEKARAAMVEKVELGFSFEKYFDEFFAVQLQK